MPYWLSDQIATEGMILPKKYTQEKGDDYFGVHPIGSGPYRFAENVRGANERCDSVGEGRAVVAQVAVLLVDAGPAPGRREGSGEA